MPTKVSPTPTSSSPPLGTFIDNGSFELVEVLGVGGYGVVYRAVDVHSARLKSYAVKCLIHSQTQQSSRQRQLHIREITLHQLASAHPNVVTLHRVIEDFHYTYLIMEYASDGDLFSQILYNCRYLGKDHLIKHIFLQLLDAVEYCHSLGIYHRDLKPENVLCFDGGLRIAITDFGLATTDRLSDEFRTGSVFHMSPECFGGEFAPSGTYSPLANDIWSLAVILLNLATGRNPWEQASSGDPTFQAYLQDPLGFLPTVLPISLELNAILTRMLEVDWTRRMTLSELRPAIENVDSFYSEGAIFEKNMARCPWEADMDIKGGNGPAKNYDMSQPHVKEELKSHWSRDSDSEMVFASQSTAAQSSWAGYSSSGATWFDSPIRSQSPSPEEMGTYGMFDTPRTPPSTYSPLSPSGSGSMPTTPSAGGVVFDDASQAVSGKSLTVNTNCGRYRYPSNNDSPTTLSTGSSTMHTAIESYGPYSSSFFLASSATQSKTSLPMPPIVDLEFMNEDTQTESITDWEYSPMSPQEVYPTATGRSALGLDDDTENEVSSPDSPERPRWETHRPQAVYATRPRHAQQISTVFAVAPSMPVPIPLKKPLQGKRSRFKLFPRSPPTSTIGSTETTRPRGSESFVHFHTISPTPSPPLPAQSAFKLTMPMPMPTTTGTKDSGCREASRLRKKHHWFSPGKLFSGAGAS